MEISRYKNIEIINLPRSITSQLSAQSGLFTLHQLNCYRGQPLRIVGLEDEFSTRLNTPLLKLTVPMCESLRLLDLCDTVGLSAAYMYPSADGAGLAVMDMINRRARKKQYDLA